MTSEAFGSATIHRTWRLGVGVGIVALLIGASATGCGGGVQWRPVWAAPFPTRVRKDIDSHIPRSLHNLFPNHEQRVQFHWTTHYMYGCKHRQVAWNPAVRQTL